TPPMRRQLLSLLRRRPPFGSLRRPSPIGTPPPSQEVANAGAPPDQEGPVRPVRVGLRAGHLVTVTTVGPFLPLLPDPFQWVGLSALVLLEELSRGSISLEASIAEACRRAHADPCDLERFAS